MATRAAIVSDIHGNVAALQAVLTDIAKRGIEDIYCLGDLVGYGPDPNGVIDLVRDRAIPTIMGNYDDGIGRDTGDCGCYYATPAARQLGEASYAFTAAAVTPEHKAFLRSLPHERHIEIGSATVHLVHGSPRVINEYLMKDRDERTFLRLAEAETDRGLAFGHTHEQWHREYGGVLFVAVGSVGRPKDGDPRAMYTILSEAPDAAADGLAAVTVEALRVAYDVEATARAVVEAGLPPELADAMRHGR